MTETSVRLIIIMIKAISGRVPALGGKVEGCGVQWTPALIP